MTFSVSKWCLKYIDWGISQGFYISTNILTPRRLSYYKNANKNIILILQSVKYKAEFYSLRELKMCQYMIGSVHTHRRLMICRRSVIYFLHLYVRNKIHTCIIFYYQISIIDFLSPEIKSVLEWWGIRLGRASLRFWKRQKHVQCNIPVFDKSR
jgi:hypothetical protein